MNSQDLGRDDASGFVDRKSPEADDRPPAESSTHDPEVAGRPEVRPRKRVRRALRRFFRPPPGSSVWLRVLPWAVGLVVVAGVVVGSEQAWAWTNSPEFCGTTCHTMPPQYEVYKISSHSRVSCVECHIGRDSLGRQFSRKVTHSRFIFQMAFGAYEYPLHVKGMRPAPEICERCHTPDKFSDDSVRIKKRYDDDESNSAYSLYLVMKTGGGTKREGLGRGIHWHVENRVEFLSTDRQDQNIPYVRVTNDDGTIEEYVDIESDFDVSSVDSASLKTMDCMTCHNRISHTIASPVDTVESAMSRGLISSDIPYIRSEAVKALTEEYATQDEAFAGIARTLEAYYATAYPDFYAEGADKLEAAIAEMQRIYSLSVFTDQGINWNTYPNNVGHVNSPGCFRCHDGKHLNPADEAVRLECNVCHSIPVVAGDTDLVTNIEISHGPEPESHRNPNWISLHNRVYDTTCANCHTTADGGGTSDTSFCSNSSCHGTPYTYAGFDAPALRQVLKGQMPAPSVVAPGPSSSGAPTYNSFFGPLFVAKCGSCHGANPSAGLDLTTYAAAMAGPDEGPVIIPGNSGQSVLVTVQRDGHFARFSAQELEAVIQWIDSGALEK